MPSGRDVASLGLPVFSAEAASSVVPASTLPQSSGGGGDKADPTAKGDCSPFSLGESLPPVPAKLVVKIRKGEYIDKAGLLRDNMEAERRRARSEASNGNSSNRRKIPDLFSWVQCFGTYAAVMTAQFPEKTRQLLAYQTMIVREARRCGGKGWLAYDSMFRQQATLDPDCDWSRLNNSLYSVTFLAQQNGRGRTCSHCLETDHASSDCALAPAPRQRQSGRDYERGPRHQFDRGERNERICYSWNDGRCAMPYCRYRHVCTKCHSSEHKAVNCSVYPPVKQGSTPAHKGVQEKQ